MKHWILRQWFYFRMGYANYWAFPIGYASNALVIFAFAFKGIIDNLFLFLALSTIFIGPVCVIFGYLHTMRHSAWSIDAAKGTEVNPYNRVAVPGKEKEIYIPLALFQLQILEYLMAEDGKLTPQITKGFAENRARLEWLRQS